MRKPKKSFQWSEGLCLPACASYSFHQENIQYVKVSQNYLSSMRNKLGLPNNVAVTSMGLIIFSFKN